MSEVASNGLIEIRVPDIGNYTDVGGRTTALRERHDVVVLEIGSALAAQAVVGHECALALVALMDLRLELRRDVAAACRCGAGTARLGVQAMARLLALTHE